VPGLAAKDIIDVQITVALLKPAVEEALLRAGYKRLAHIAADHVPPGGSVNPEDWQKWFFKPMTGQRAAHVHVRIAGRPNQRYPLLFRDYLQAHTNAAEAYARVKVALAKHHADDIYAFCDIKDPVCDILIDGAERWATLTRWVAGSSDA
jgi:GrpB-like predicted nucleotidyltransferase (UPF0157 family)